MSSVRGFALQIINTNLYFRLLSKIQINSHILSDDLKLWHFCEYRNQESHKSQFCKQIRRDKLPFTLVNPSLEDTEIDLSYR